MWRDKRAKCTSSIDNHRDYSMGVAGGWEISKRDEKPQKGKALVQLNYHQ